MDRYESAYDKFNEYDQTRETPDFDDFEEFMRKVEEVNKMVHALASGDKAQVEEATKSADTWLANQKREKSTEKEVNTEETINNPSQCAKPTKIPKSVINHRESRKEKPKTDLGNLNNDTMSQEEFMRSVEEDAKKRSEDRKKRIVESDAIKAKANKVFEEGDYEKALDLYNKAIDVRKDSSVLYMNRAQTLLNLELYTRALKDSETALRLDENSLRARLYKWHSLYEMGEHEKAQECMQELKSTLPDRLKEIEEYQKTFQKEEDET